MLRFAIPFALTAAALAAEDAMVADRLEQMLAEGDDVIVMHVFKRYPGEVLPFIDQYLEGGLKLIEDGEGREKAMESFRRGIEFAQLADKAFPGATFTDYAASFAGWSPSEQKQFREGQAAIGAARQAKDDPVVALEHYQRALELAKPLNDLWGMAMANAGLARTHLALNEHEKVAAAANQALQLYAQLRLQRPQIDLAILMGDADATMGGRSAGANNYGYAWSLAQDSGDAELMRLTLSRYIGALETIGQQQAADQLRKQHAEVLTKRQ